MKRVVLIATISVIMEIYAYLNGDLPVPLSFTMAALMGTLPIAIGLGAGGESRQPLGLAVVVAS